MAETLVLRQSRKKIALVLLISAGFVALGVWLVAYASPDSSRHSPEMLLLIGWSNILLFGAFGLKGLFSLVRPIQVVLNPEGFQVFGVRRRPPVRWQDVERFFMGQVNRAKFVCYDVKSEIRPNLRQAMGAGSSQWGDGQLPGALEIGPNELLQLFDDWHRRHGA